MGGKSEGGVQLSACPPLGAETEELWGIFRLVQRRAAQGRSS
jgi:hypothetical protein